MKAKKISLVLSLICLFSSLTIFSAFAEVGWKLSTSATFERGTYGTGTTTDSIYAPVTLKRYFERGDFSVTVPYVILEGNGIITFVNGMPHRVNNKAGPVTTASGLGDILVEGSIYALKDQPLDVSLVGSVKFPTADKNEGLGTGEFDEMVGVELGKDLSPKWNVFANGYYTFTGSPPGQDFKNIFSYSFGISDHLTKSLTVSLSYTESTPLTSGNPDLKEVVANMEYKITNETLIFGGVSAGLSTSSPDHDVTAGISAKF